DGYDEASGKYYWFYPHLKGFNFNNDLTQMTADEIEAANWPAKAEVSVIWSEEDSYTYNGTKQAPEVTSVTVGDTSVPEGGDVTYSQYTYSDENNRWEWEDISVTPTGHGNYKMEISFGEDTVTKYFTILDPATDYTVSYYKKTGEDWSMNSVDPIDAGDYKAVVTFTDTGHDQIEKMFTINPKSLTGAIVTLSQVTAEYTGGGIMPEVTEVKVGEKVLNKNTDYIVSYGDNINASENAKVIVTGKGNYKDSVEKMFTISPAGVTLTANSRNTDIYDGTEKTVTGFTSSVSDLTFDGVTASGSGTNAGSYVVSFSGVTINETTDTTGNYVVTGTVDGILTINPADPEMNAAAQDVDYGQTAVVTFTAPADAKGKVTFTLDEAESGVTKDIENGQAVCEFENLTIGSHKVECVYTGDSNYESGDAAIANFEVKSIDCALTINYVYADGTQAAETYTDNVEIFKEYSVESPEITGYTPDIATVEGTMGDEDMNGKTVTVTYSPIEYTATFVDENGKTVKAVKFTVETEKLDEPDVPEKAGYAGEWEEYTLAASNITIKPVYANITSIQIENYEENSETGYKEDKTFTIKADDLPDGAEIHWFVNGEDVGTGESYTVEDPTDDYTVQAKVIDKDGNTLDTTKVQSVKVRNGFFDRLKAFFAELIEKILGKAIADFLSSVC
ncbi:MAG: Ig-like domain repeat protein, partial [Clostridia bacterium]|nr:Ig-like domain repeat protein [Clostridia bacterium]